MENTLFTLSFLLLTVPSRVICNGLDVLLTARQCFLADRTATQYHRLLASSCCPSVYDAVHCGSQGRCTRVKVSPACS